MFYCDDSKNGVSGFLKAIYLHL